MQRHGSLLAQIADGRIVPEDTVLAVRSKQDQRGGRFPTFHFRLGKLPEKPPGIHPNPTRASEENRVFPSLARGTSRKIISCLMPSALFKLSIGVQRNGARASRPRTADSVRAGMPAHEP